ncbi:MAG: Holliday junction resolvase RuvX [Actinomycetales bacterium]|jgi:putative holliday junction resolvase|nr:Holliday junction resolvase RuvX [Actinomycetales bacterium]
MSFGRRLGIDYGQARVGIAICDVDGLVATPLITLKNDKTLFAKLEELIAEHNIVGVFLGKPKHLSGVEGATVELVSKFAQRFEESFTLPITYVDERLTSGGAEKLLKSAGKTSKESKGLIDQLAAVAILELGIQIEKRG